MTIIGDPEVGEPDMFGKGVYLSMFYCLCYSKDISTDMSEDQVAEDREIQTWMRRRISYWMKLGKSIGGMFLRKVTIRRRFMP